jgi:WW domain-containing oxidoreductase
VLGLGRNFEKTANACKTVTGGSGRGKALPFVCDQANFDSVASCADAVRKLDHSLDILICNAGVYFWPQLELVHGAETHFAVNHLSHFILVNRLLDRVTAAAHGRVVILSSAAAHLYAQDGIDFDNLAGQKGYDPNKMYSQSKLANALFSRKLAGDLSDTSATANAIDPGWVMTETMRRIWIEHKLDPEGAKIQIGERQVAAKTPEQGAATTCYVATHPDIAEISGAYFEDCQSAFPRGHLFDDRMAEKLWDLSQDLTGGYLV